jgi:3-deoxy-D-manno-octulosonate 8-phosphate phosphatase (KDO 8-P phosphatase)
MQRIIEKAKKIRLVIFDVDGVLTDGSLIYGKNGIEQQVFNVHDGQGMKFLLESGVQIAIITARASEIIVERTEALGVVHVYQGNSNKLPAYEDLKKKLQLSDEEIAYIGDDIPDLPILYRVGLPITVADAPQITKQYVCWVTESKGGKGAAREVCDLIMSAQGTYQGIVEKYLQRQTVL